MQALLDAHSKYKEYIIQNIAEIKSHGDKNGTVSLKDGTEIKIPSEWIQIYKRQQDLS
jgi:hypothetical protein